MGRKQLVTVVIPCYNEAASIAKVLRDFHTNSLARASFDFDLLVVDNNSTDGTASIAEQAGARVIHETRKGKGYAMRTGFMNVHPRAKYVLMLDGDYTYRPEEALRLLEPLHHDFCDVVVGSRLSGKMHKQAMPFLNRGFNWLCVHIVRFFYEANVTDVLSGYFAWKREVVDSLVPHLCSPGFALEVEMVTKLARMRYEIYSVPISYQERLGVPHIRAIDSIPILRMLFRNLWWSPNSLTASEEMEPATES